MSIQTVVKSVRNSELIWLHYLGKILSVRIDIKNLALFKLCLNVIERERGRERERVCGWAGVF